MSQIHPGRRHPRIDRAFSARRGQAAPNRATHRRLEPPRGPIAAAVEPAGRHE